MSRLGDSFYYFLGHCVAAYPTNITLRVGSTNKNSGGRIIKIADIIEHPRFDRVNLVYDFALLIFDEPIVFDQYVQPVKLPNEFEEVPDGTKCLVSGWGKMENEERPQQLRSVEVSIVNFVSFFTFSFRFKLL